MADSRALKERTKRDGWWKSNGINLTQKFVFESDSHQSLSEMLETICKIFMRTSNDSIYFVPPYTFKELRKIKKPSEIILAEAIKYLSKEEQALYVALNVDTPEQLTKLILESIEDFDFNSIGELAENSLQEWFDGSVGVGFRLETTWDRKITASICPIYYDK